MAMEPPVAVRRATPCATRRSRCCARCGRSAQDRVHDDVVRGQYAAGSVGGDDGARLPRGGERGARLRRPRLSSRSSSSIDNWRWAGVPVLPARRASGCPSASPRSPSTSSTLPHALFSRAARASRRAERAGAPHPARRGHLAEFGSKVPGPAMRDRAGDDGVPLRHRRSASSRPRPTSGSSSTHARRRHALHPARRGGGRLGATSRTSSTAGRRTRSRACPATPRGAGDRPRPTSSWPGRDASGGA